jgi:hypothetical protein
MSQSKLELKRSLFEQYEHLSLRALNVEPEELLVILNEREQIKQKINELDSDMDDDLKHLIERIQVIDELILQQMNQWRLAAQEALETSKRLKQISNYFMPSENIDIERKG